MKLTQESAKIAVKETGSITNAAKYFGVSRALVAQYLRGHGGAESLEVSIENCRMLQALTTKPMRIRL